MSHAPVDVRHRPQLNEKSLSAAMLVRDSLPVHSSPCSTIFDRGLDAQGRTSFERDLRARPNTGRLSLAGYGRWTGTLRRLAIHALSGRAFRLEAIGPSAGSRSIEGRNFVCRYGVRNDLAAQRQHGVGNVGWVARHRRRRLARRHRAGQYRRGTAWAFSDDARGDPFSAADHASRRAARRSGLELGESTAGHIDQEGTAGSIGKHLVGHPGTRTVHVSSPPSCRPFHP